METHYIVFLVICAVGVLIGFSLIAYSYYYFGSKNFSSFKTFISPYVDNYIEQLSAYNSLVSSQNRLIKGTHFHSCSPQILNNSKTAPYKYINKYFKFENTNENLSLLKKSLGNLKKLSSDLQRLSKAESDTIEKINEKVPFIINFLFKSKIYNEIGFNNREVNSLKHRTYIFVYQSPGGRKSSQNQIVLDLAGTTAFISYMEKNLEQKSFSKKQRSLMTDKLREKIKKRDNYTCVICGASIFEEPNLLLEVDHIIPVSKGGQTVESNLRTLCWKCNRSKSSK